MTCARRPRPELWLPLLGMVAACSDFFGPGPDPSRAGPFLGASASGGDGAVGSGGDATAGSNPACSSQPLNVLLAQASADCADVRACAKTSCDGQLQQCLGPGYARGNLSGPCQGYVACAAACNCNQNCIEGCSTAGDACRNCVTQVQDCMQSACSAALGACQTANGKAALLVSNLTSNVGSLAVDGDSLYFTTNQGVAKIPKAGGKAQALGGFANLSGLAVGGGFIYVVVDSGAVSRMKLDGSQPTTIVPPTMFGSGSGPIALDDAKLFFLVGADVRRAPLAGGSPEVLANDVWQQGPNSAQRLALGAAAVYYVGGGPNPGTSSQISMVQKDAPATSGNGAPGMQPGSPIAAAHGEIRGLVSDSNFAYFADLTSDGLKLVLEIRKVDPDTKQTSLLATVTPMNNGGASAALATDGENVFFGGSTGLFEVAPSGGKVTTLDASAQPSSIVLDDNYIYWAEQQGNGAIKRLPKSAMP